MAIATRTWEVAAAGIASTRVVRIASTNEKMNRLLRIILDLSGVDWAFSCLIESGRSPHRPHLQAQTFPDSKAGIRSNLSF
jgi:hypothetical protein